LVTKIKQIINLLLVRKMRLTGTGWDRKLDYMKYMSVGGSVGQWVGRSLGARCAGRTAGP